MDVLRLDAGGYLIDLDGTLVSGRVVLPDAAWLLDQVAGRFMLVSNDSEHTPEQLSRNLRHMGLPVMPGQILLAGTATIDIIVADYPKAKVLLLASSTLRAYARRSGVWLDAEHPDLVVVMRDRKFSYAKLAAAAEAVSRGARLIVACPDTSHPGASGQPVPEAGALAAAILSVTGQREYRVIGKPEPAIFRLACDKLGVAPQEAIMIGDNPLTDGLGAQRLDMAFVQVRNGRIPRPEAGLSVGVERSYRERMAIGV